jgi:hypothetical protein
LAARRCPEPAVLPVSSSQTKCKTILRSSSRPSSLARRRRRASRPSRPHVRGAAPEDLSVAALRLDTRVIQANPLGKRDWAGSRASVFCMVRRGSGVRVPASAPQGSPLLGIRSLATAAAAWRSPTALANTSTKWPCAAAPPYTDCSPLRSRDHRPTRDRPPPLGRSPIVRAAAPTATAPPRRCRVRAHRADAAEPPPRRAPAQTVLSATPGQAPCVAITARTQGSLSRHRSRCRTDAGVSSSSLGRLIGCASVGWTTGTR